MRKKTKSDYRGKISPGAHPEGWGADVEFALEPENLLESLKDQQKDNDNKYE